MHAGSTLQVRTLELTVVWDRPELARKILAGIKAEEPGTLPEASLYRALPASRLCHAAPPLSLLPRLPALSPLPRLACLIR